jgi:hypothetical protein
MEGGYHMLRFQPAEQKVTRAGDDEVDRNARPHPRECSSVRFWSKRRILATGFYETIRMRYGIRTLVLILRGTFHSILQTSRFICQIFISGRDSKFVEF